MTSTYIHIQCTTSCHAGQQPGIAQKAARNRRRQGAANIRSGGHIPRKHSPDGATWHASENQACYSFNKLTPEG